MPSGTLSSGTRNPSSQLVVCLKAAPNYLLSAEDSACHIHFRLGNLPLAAVLGLCQGFRHGIAWFFPRGSAEGAFRHTRDGSQDSTTPGTYTGRIAQGE